MFKDNNPDGAYPTGCLFKNQRWRLQEALFELAKKNGTCLSDHMSGIMNFQAI